jgi:two-component system, NtrC family, sensor histidine kinase HydH
LESVPPRPQDDRLSNRLAWVTGLRLGFLSLLLGATAFFYLRGALSQYPQSQAMVLGAIGAAFALAAIYAAMLRRRQHLHRLAVVQIILDQLTWTAIVYVSGGATSGATSFYGLTCLVGAVLIGLRGAAIAAITGIGAFAILCVGFGFGWVVPPEDQRGGNYILDWDAIIYPLAVNALGIVVVALLAGYLADRLRRTGGALVEANERAASAERLAMLGRIAAGLAHEIRNPLGSISGSIELLREAPGLGDEDRRLCEIIQREAGRLNHLVSDMMDLARPRPPEPVPVDVVALARDVVALASRSDRSGAGDVAIEYEGPEEPIFAICDSGQMRQVLWNLIRNGVQASGAGQKVRVSVSEAPPPHGRKGGRVLMAVSDQGPGIEPEARAKIFDAFFTTRSHGTGMGLAVVRRIIDDHASVGATITVRAGLLTPIATATDGAEAAQNDGGSPSSSLIELASTRGKRRTGATFEVGLARASTPARRSVASATTILDVASDNPAPPYRNAPVEPPEN